MNLYKVKLQGMTYTSTSRPHGISYVVAENPTDAYEKAKNYLDKKDYGFPHERQLNTIELVAEEYEYGRLPQLFL